MKTQYILVFLLLSLLVVSCSDFPAGTTRTPAPTRTLSPTPSVTLIPAFVSTAQIAEAGAQATISYAQAAGAEADLAQSYLNVTQTVIAMAHDSAISTQQYFVSQTQDAASATSIASRQAAEGTATERAFDSTAAAQAFDSTAVAQRVTMTRQALDIQTTATQRAYASSATIEAVNVSIRTTATQAALGIIQAQAAAEARSIERKSQAEAQTAFWRTWSGRMFWATVAVVFFAILLYCLWTFRMAIFARLGLIRWGSSGKPYVIVPTPGGLVLLDMTRSGTPAQLVANDAVTAAGGIGDPALQAQIAARSQAAELLLAANTHETDYRRIAQRQQAVLKQAGQSGGMLPTGQAEQTKPVITASLQLPPVAPWNLVDRWHGRSLPLGVSSSGLVTADPERTPHLLIAGTSGSGKTMTGLRPLTAYALAGGYRIILLNDAGGDFAPLQDHPNLVMVDQSPTAIADALDYVAGEVQRRSGILRAAGVSTWLRLPPELRSDPPIMVVIDELVALAITADGHTRERIWRAAINITSKGRKMDMAFVAATTDPTYRTLGKEGLIMRDNCGRIAFRMRDESTSRAMLDQGGAENLKENQFLAMLNGSLVRGVAFHPEDDDLVEFLDNRPTPALPELAWTPGEPAEDSDTIDLANRVRPLWQSKASKRAMARAVGETYAGAFCSRLDRAIEWLENAATTLEVVAIETE